MLKKDKNNSIHIPEILSPAGTGEAMKMGQLEGAVAGMAIGLMGVATAIVVPIVELFIK